MGWFLRVNAFHEVDPEAVDAAVTQFWTQHGRRVEPAPDDERADAFELLDRHNDWTRLFWNGGWEWDLRRAAQLHVSRELGCAGILVFVYDGGDWGYELFDRGAVIDRFIWDDTESVGWFPGLDVRGDAAKVAATFGVDPPRLVHLDYDGDLDAQMDELHALHFLNALGAGGEVYLDGIWSRIDWHAPVWRRFVVEPPPKP